MRVKHILFAFLLNFTTVSVFAADLLEVAQQALENDPIYQQAIAQRLASRENVPISVASLLPQAALTANPSITRTAYSGANFSSNIVPRNNTTRANSLTLTITQTVFDFAKFAHVASSVSTAKGADATLNASLQNLIIRVANAYFSVLQDEDNLGYSAASKLAFAEQLDQVKQQYDVGLKTITEVYTARASYDSAVAKFISAEAKLATDKENLRAITSKYYDKLSSLREDFPLVTPQPADAEKWVAIAQQQNWSVKAEQFATYAAKNDIKQQFAGHLPTVNLEGTLDRLYSNNINSYRNLDARSGPSTQTDRGIALTVTLPLSSGGAVIAQTNQATYNYQIAQQKLEQTLRTTTSTTRQSYLNIISGISQIKADQQAIKSNRSSLEGMEASYRVGTETLVNVLNQQEKLYQAQTEYAQHRYDLVNNVLALKQAAGTLSFEDLRALNLWLTDKEKIMVKKRKHRKRK